MQNGYLHLICSYLQFSAPGGYINLVEETWFIYNKHDLGATKCCTLLYKVSYKIENMERWTI